MRVGLVGFGLAGAAFHAPLIRTTPGLELTAILTSRSVPDGVLRVGSFDGLVDLGLDLAVIATPNSSHVSLARAALDAGMDVVVDKPLAVTSAEAADLAAYAEKKGRLLSVFQNRRWDGDFLTLCDLLAAGRLGQIHRFESRFERWRPSVAEAWRESGDPADGGGQLLDLGTHLVDQALRLLGPVTHVYAELANVRPSAIVEDDVFLALRHAAGAVSHLWMSAVSTAPGPRLRALGDAGAWTSWTLDTQEHMLRAGEDPRAAGFGANPDGVLNESAHPTRSGTYAAYYSELVEAMAGKAPNPVDPLEVVAGLRVIEAARASSESRTVVAL